MPEDHTVHSINLALLSSHVDGSRSAISELDGKFSAFENFAESGDYRRSSSILSFLREMTSIFMGSEIGWVRRRTTERWTIFDDYFDATVALLKDNPNAHGLELVIYRPYDESALIIGLANAQGQIDYRHLSEGSKEIAHRIDPDFYLSSVLNAPPEKYQHAYAEWLNDALERTPIYTSTFFLSAEVQIKWLEIGAELTYQEEQFPDGSVSLTFAVSGNIGAGFDGKWIEASAGLEGGFLVEHRFDSKREADAYVAALVDKLVPKLSTSVGTVLNPLTPPVTFSPDYVGAAQLLSDSSSLESSVASVGVYASANFEAEAPKWVEAEVGASISVGYGRDFVSDEHILYFDGTADLGIEELAGFEALEAGVEFNFRGEQRWNSEGQSYVDMEFALQIAAGSDLDQLSEVFPDVDFAVGQEIMLRAYLELDDGTATAAWDNLLNPLDGSLDLIEFVNRADLTLQTSTVAETEFVDFDIAVLEVESGVEVKETQNLWVKPPGQGFKKVNL